MVWRRIGTTAWAGLSCTECRGSLSVPWYYRRVPGKHLRICSGCYFLREHKRKEQRRDPQPTLFRDQPGAITRLGPPYAARHPLPADYTPTGSQIAPWE